MHILCGCFVVRAQAADTHVDREEKVHTSGPNGRVGPATSLLVSRSRFERAERRRCSQPACVDLTRANRPASAFRRGEKQSALRNPGLRTGSVHVPNRLRTGLFGKRYRTGSERGGGWPGCVSSTLSSDDSVRLFAFVYICFFCNHLFVVTVVYICNRLFVVLLFTFVCCYICLNL